MFFFMNKEKPKKRKKKRKRKPTEFIQSVNTVVKEVDENNLTNKSLSFFNWVQEFSKKIVSITFGIFVIINLYVLIIITVSYFQTGDLQYIETLITEANQTFRDVIGGYIIKAATENAIKIAGGLLEKFLEHRLQFKYGITGGINFEKFAPTNEAEDDPDCEEIEEDYPEDELLAAQE